MNHLLKISASFILLCLTALAFAEQKIAVVNLEQALENSAYAQEKLQQLQGDKTFKTNFESYQNLNAEFKELQDNARVNSVTWSDKQKQEYNKQREEKIKQLSAIGQQIERQRSAAVRDVEKQMTPFLQQAVRTIIEEQELDLLIKDSSLYFYKPTLNLTDELTSRLDKLQAAE